MKRFLYEKLMHHLPKKQITLLVGARQVGKTTLLRQIYNSLTDAKELAFFISLEDKHILQLLNDDYKNLFQLIPASEIKQRMHVLIDEIQYLDDPSGFLKFHYDTAGESLKFIVSGSSHFYIDKKFKDSMSGRKRIFELPVLSIEEVLHFRGKDELYPYIGSCKIPIIYKDEIMRHVYDYLIYGGYPDVVLEPDHNERREILKELRDSYAKKDVQDAGISNQELYRNLMKILADQIGSLLNLNSLSRELFADNKTLKNYLWVMRKSFHVHCVAPFHKRAASELRKMQKIYFADLGLRNSLLNNFAPVGEREDRGYLMENFVYLRLREGVDNELIKYWRTQNKQEVDFVFQRGDGTFLACEVKYTGRAYKESKYAHFRKCYPEIPLSCVSMGNVMEYDFR